MFQPFKEKWVQALGCFLSLGSASGTILHQLVMECIILVKRSGFKIHAVASDGASWNRAMWDKFGVMEEEVSVSHIIDSKQRLWFISDFPHLIKCFRNFFPNTLNMRAFGLVTLCINSTNICIMQAFIIIFAVFLL